LARTISASAPATTSRRLAAPGAAGKNSLQSPASRISA
jgi:hypothetical protein